MIMNFTLFFGLLLFATSGFGLVLLTPEKRNDLEMTSNPILARSDVNYVPRADISNYKRFELIHDHIQIRKREELSSSTPSSSPEPENLPEPELESNLTSTSIPTEQKSSIGDTVKKVEKTWVKIVEIVVPIVVGLLLLLILSVTCCVCYASRRAKREMKV